MEVFKNLTWRIQDVTQLDKLPHFINEETFFKSTVFSKPNGQLIKENSLVDANGMKNVTDDLKFKNIPGYIPLPTSSEASLTHNEHVQCLSALKILLSGQSNITGKERCNIQKYNQIKHKIVLEQSKFVHFVQEKWNETKDIKTKEIKPSIEAIVNNFTREQKERFLLYPRYYKKLTMLPLVFQEKSVEMFVEKHLLEIGEIPQINLPVLKRHFNLFEYKLQSESEDAVCVETIPKVSVSFDKQAELLATSHEVDVVISSSGLKAIIDNYAPFNANWNIPVVIKEYNSVKNERQIKHNIVFIDKPLPRKKRTVFQKQMWAHKKMVKNTFCVGTPFRNLNCGDQSLTNSTNIDSGTESSSSMYCDVCIEEYNSWLKLDDLLNVQDFNETNKIRKITAKKNSRNIEDSESESDRLIIDESEESNVESVTSTVKLDVLPVKSEGKLCKCGKFVCNKKNKATDFLNIKKQLLSVNSAISDETKKYKRNRTYRLWKIRPKEYENEMSKLKNKEISVIVRCQFDGCETNDACTMPITIVPKLEYQLEYGAECSTKSELYRQWTSLYFRPYSELVRVRINPIDSEVVTIDRCNLTNIKNEAARNGITNINDGLSTLYSVFKGLTSQPPGEYILSHASVNGPFAVLYKSCSEFSDQKFDLYEMYEKEQINKDEVVWRPIDVNVILPNHTCQQTLPGMFKAKLKPKETKKTTGLKKNWKKHKGKKKPNVKKGCGAKKEELTLS